MAGTNRDIPPQLPGGGAENDRRLNSWKEIAAYFGKDERTVKRWEVQRGLPVHRLPGGARTTVFAFAGELEQWLRSGRDKRSTAATPSADGAAALTIDAPMTATLAGSPPSMVETKRDRTSAWRTDWRIATVAGLAMVAVAAVAANVAFHPARQAPAIADARPAHRPPPDAVDLYLRGTYAWNERTPESLGKAVAFFNDAIARDPDYAAAYAGLANAYNLLAQYTSHAGTSAYAQAHAAAERARALDPNNADAYAALGFATFYGGHNLAEASTLLRKALALDPNQARIWHWYAMITMHTGKFDEPLAAIRRAQELAPDQRAILANRGLITFLAGESDEALSILTDLVESAPDFLPPHYYLASIYLDQGRYGDYLRESLRATELDRDEDAHAMFEAAARAFDQGGAPAMLTEMLADQTARYTAGNESAFNVARTAAVLGKRQLALDYLLKSKDAGEPEFVGIHVDTMLKSLRDDETYRHLAAAAF